MEDSISNAGSVHDIYKDCYSFGQEISETEIQRNEIVSKAPLFSSVDNLNSSSHELLINPTSSRNHGRQMNPNESFKGDEISGLDGGLMGVGNNNFRIRRAVGPNSSLLASGTNIIGSTQIIHCGSSAVLNEDNNCASEMLQKSYWIIQNRSA